MSLLEKLFGRARRPYETTEVYQSLRQQILELAGSGADFGPTDRYAILMETGLEEACYTLVAVADGSVSLYFSNGGGIMGAGQHPPCAAVAQEFLQCSREFDQLMTRADEYPLPLPGTSRFYVVRQRDVLTAEFPEADLGNHRVPLSPLFHKGHELITMIRSVEEQLQRGPDGAAADSTGDR